MPRNRIIMVTIGIMLSLFLASMESTVVATATPTIVGELGGLSHFSWVFSAYMLASTTTVPLYGKLSDLYGRRNLYLIAMALFLVGSVWCGQAGSMTQLILARGLQGIGSGGIMPLAFILIGEMCTREQRTVFQGGNREPALVVLDSCNQKVWKTEYVVWLYRVTNPDAVLVRFAPA